MRTERYRYTRSVYQPRGSAPPLRVVHQDELVSVELYDHVNDPFETRNVADNPSYREVVQEMETKMIAGWRDAMPQPSPQWHRLQMVAAAGSQFQRQGGVKPKLNLILITALIATIYFLLRLKRLWFSKIRVPML